MNIDEAGKSSKMRYFRFAFFIVFFLWLLSNVDVNSLFKTPEQEIEENLESFKFSYSFVDRDSSIDKIIGQVSKLQDVQRKYCPQVRQQDVNIFVLEEILTMSIYELLIDESSAVNITEDRVSKLNKTLYMLFRSNEDMFGNMLDELRASEKFQETTQRYAMKSISKNIKRDYLNASDTQKEKILNTLALLQCVLSTYVLYVVNSDTTGVGLKIAHGLAIELGLREF